MSLPKFLSSLSLAAGVASIAAIFSFYILPDLTISFGDYFWFYGGLTAILSGFVSLSINQTINRKVALTGIILGALSFMWFIFLVFEVLKSSM